jgi:hypothetical protein
MKYLYFSIIVNPRSKYEQPSKKATIRNLPKGDFKRFVSIGIELYKGTFWAQK